MDVCSTYISFTSHNVALTREYRVVEVSRMPADVCEHALTFSSVIHAEMPVHAPGVAEPRGLQLWVDLPKEVRSRPCGPPQFLIHIFSVQNGRAKLSRTGT